VEYSFESQTHFWQFLSLFEELEEFQLPTIAIDAQWLAKNIDLGKSDSSKFAFRDQARRVLDTTTRYVKNSLPSLRMVHGYFSDPDGKQETLHGEAKVRYREKIGRDRIETCISLY
jgi:hypothetical protein